MASTALMLLWNIFAAIVQLSASSTAHPGRTMCEAARSHLNTLRPMVEKFTKNGNQAKIDRLFARIQAKSVPLMKEYPEQHAPTEVVNMNMPDALQDEIIRDVEFVKMVEQKMWDVMDTHATGYSIFSLAFENVMLFVPACTEFMEQNRAMIKGKLPWLDTCTCNTFLVSAGSGRKVYGTHKASSFGHRNDDMAPRDWLSPHSQMSFHTAITPTNATSAPFVIFDDHVPAVMNDDFLIDYLMKADLHPDMRETVKRAATALHPRLAQTSDLYPVMPTNLRPALRNFLLCNYLVQESCSEPSKFGGTGSYWDLEAGQALFFNNWRVHSDSGVMDLPHVTDEHPRISLDLRCYSKVEVPWPFNSDWEFYAALYPKLAIYEELAIECIARMFNYTSRWDFLQTVFPGNKLDNVMAAVGSVILQHASGGDYSLLSERAAPGMQRHFERLKKARAEGNDVNYKAFQACYKEYQVEFEDPAQVDINAHFSEQEVFVRALKYKIFSMRVKLGGPAGEVAILLACAVTVLFCSFTAVQAKRGLPVTVLLGLLFCCGSSKKKAD